MGLVRNKILAGVSALALAGAAALAGAGTSSAATPSCGSKCIDIFSEQFGTYAHPGFTLDVLRQGARVNQPVILFRQSNSDAAQDFTLGNEGQVSTFYAAGLVSSSLALHYGCTGSINIPGGQIVCGPTARDLYAFEVEYAPFGVDSGLCVGLAATAVAGERVSLQPCGVSAKTVWVADTLDSCPRNPLYSLEVQAINGSTTNFSHPHVLTYPAAGFPTDKPRPQLFVSNLTGFSQTGGTGGSAVCGGLSVTGPDTNQLWGALQGILP